DNLASANMQVDSIDDGSAAVDLDQLIGSQDSLPLCFDRRRNFPTRNGGSLANHGLGKDGAGDAWAAGVWEGFACPFLSSPFFSWSGCWTISVRLGPCVLSCLF